MKKILENIVATKPYSLITVIAKLWLSYDDVDTRFNNLLKNKCYSWAVPELISIDFTHQLFDIHYEDIENQRKDFAFSNMWFDTSDMEDIKLDFVRSTVDYIIECISQNCIDEL